MINILAIEPDDQFRETLDVYAQQLELQLFSFSGYEQLADCKEITSHKIDLVFIAVSEDDESGFEISLKVKKHILKEDSASIIFLLNSHHDKHYIQSLKYGDGYLLKPFSSDLLLSSIHYYIRLHNINFLLAQKNKKLMEYQAMTKREHDIVETIFAKHCQKHLVSSNNINIHISPASIFNGDILLTSQGPSGSLYLAVGDVTGHGLAAAIGALPAYSVFRDMATEGKSVGNIAEKMNDALRSLLPDNMMMAATLMELDFIKGQAHIWSGGMPQVLIVRSHDGTIDKIASRHAPLSMLDSDSFRKDVDIIPLNKQDRLFFYTDGIEEATNSNNEMMGTKAFQDLFTVEGSEIFNHIIQSHTDFIDGSLQDDDITLAEIIYEDQSSALQLLAEKTTPKNQGIPWNFDFTLGTYELKNTDPVAQIIKFLNNAVDIDAHQDGISTILSELYNNSLNHGLLQLDSSIKDGDDGFINYYIEQKNKLRQLDEGEINIKMRYGVNDEQDGVLTIEITDSGSGFDPQASSTYAAGNIADNSLSYGRGMALVQQLCESLEYSNQGRTAKAVYYVDRSKYTIMQ